MAQGSLTQSLPTGTNSIGRAAIDQTTNIIAATTMQNAAVAVGNGTNLNVQGYVSAIISITGTMSAGTTVTFKASTDDVFFDFISAHQIGVSGNLSNTTTNIGNYRISCAAFKSLQAIITTYGAGTVTVKGTVSVLSGHPTTVNSNIIAALPAGTNTIGTVIIQTAATSIITSATAAITSTTVLAANANRKGAYFYNDSTSVLYLAYAATASNTAYTVQLAANSYYEMPEKPLYTGLMTGIWVAAVGAVRVTELS